MKSGSRTRLHPLSGLLAIASTALAACARPESRSEEPTVEVLAPEEIVAEPEAPPILPLSDEPAPPVEADVVAEPPQAPPSGTPTPPPGAAELFAVAGSEIPAGIPANRAAERGRVRSESRATLAASLDPASPDRARWIVALREALELPPGERGWIEAARIVGALGVYELAPKLVPELAAGRPAERRIVVQGALHRLFGGWFETPEEAAPFLAQVAGDAGSRLLVRELLEVEQSSKSHLIESLRHDPAASTAWLADPDPELRASSAGLVGRAVADGSLPAEANLDLLLDRLELERDVHAFHAALEAALAPLEGASIDDPHVVRLRAILDDLVQEVANREASDLRALPVARALARVPWNADPESAESSQRTGLFVGIRQVGRLLDANRGPGDPDAVVGQLEALQALCDRARAAGLGDELPRTGARLAVFGLLQDPAQPEAVRAAAVAAAGPFALPEDWSLMTDVLMKNNTPPALSHALLGALRSILLEFDPETPGAALVMDQVATMAGAQDPDLRRRALSLLEEEGLEPLVADLDPNFLVERLAAEEVPDLTGSLLSLVNRFGEPQMLRPILAITRFDELASSETGHPVKLVAVLATLADGRSHETMAAASRLVEVDAEGTRLMRTRQALTLVAGLGIEAVRELSAAEHRDVCGWTWNLYASGVSLGDAVAEGVVFVGRLVEIHLPAAKGAPPGGSFHEGQRQHLLALARAELVNEGLLADDPALVEEPFADALAFAPAGADGRFGLMVRRDRARYRAGRESADGVTRSQAMADYRGLFDAEDVLENDDLRTAVRLLDAIGGDEPAGRRAMAPQAFEWMDLLVHRAAWLDEPAAVRMQDLRDLARVALASESPINVRRFESLLDDLPTQPPENGSAQVLPRAVWRGLARDPDRLAELQELRARSREALRASVREAAAGGD